MRVVFDTNVLLSSVLWHGSVSQKLLFKLIHSDVEIFSSIEIISEFHKVLKRDFEYSDDEITYILEKIFSFVTLIRPLQKLDIVKDDPEDNKIIECAVAASSDYIITYDKHLLNLKEFKNIKIITPEKALELIK